MLHVDRAPHSLLVLSLVLLPLISLLASCTDATSRASEGKAGASHAHGHATGHSHAELPSASPSPYPDRVVLNWSKDPASTLSVTWRTDPTVTGAQAQIAPARAEPSFYTKARTVSAQTTTIPAGKVDQANVAAKYHSVTFEGLEADSLYAYRVGDGTRWSEWIHAETAAAEPEPFSFIYLGDAQNNVRSHWSRLIRQAYSDASGVSFMLHAGDLVNNAHRNLEWGHWNEAGGFVQSMVPNVAVPGNHEYEGYEHWTARDTFTVEVTASSTEMTGTIMEPGGNPESLEATRREASPSSDVSPVGTWNYNVDNGEYVGTLTIEKGSPDYTATMVSESGTEIPLQNVSVDGTTLTGEFLMEVEKESEEKLSVHWRPQFTLPTNGPEGLKETVYYLDHQGMRIVALNTEAARNDDEVLAAQTEWLRSTLEDTRQDDEIRWIVATFHHPMFSSGEGRTNERLREEWRPIFDEYNVDLVMQGHDHTYARGQAENLTQGVSARSPEGGTVYVNSVSGAKMYEIKPDRWDDFENITMERGAENTQLYQVVRVERDTMKYRSYTATGTLYDAFDLVRRPGKPNEMIERDVANTPERTHENTLEYARP
ncbi:fibronectin type III domain-containing protein [Salinibacter altiplanensis]|uniref:fibronectin type III domain-containing protein n=1 Tax=Salinibacter altiplanensis TaxID=1803181 RepID=UPI000C9F10A0|nr:fibronectin type III domain-containing protein [Salinibacter altiplanensis]